MVWYQGAGTASPNYLYADHQGSIIAIADASGNVVNINAYDEYGIPNATNTGRFQYTGQAWLPDLQAYHYKARIYSPTLGRFYQTNPIGYDDGLNIYAYVANDPVNMRDPSGLLRCTGNVGCEDVHKAAETARQNLSEASAKLRNLAEAVKGGGQLSADQSALKRTFEKKFGEGSASSNALNSAAGKFDRAASKIGLEGEGARVRFGGPSASALATASIGGNSITIKSGFFSQSAKIQSVVIGHEAGHMAGLRDRAINNAPLGLGMMSLGARRAYGQAATDWLGANAPSTAKNNNDSYMCMAQECFP